MIYHRQACDGDNGSLVIVLMTVVAPIRRYFIPRGDPNTWRCKVPAIYLLGRLDAASDFAVFSVGGNRDNLYFLHAIYERLNAFRVDTHTCATFIGD